MAEPLEMRIELGRLAVPGGRLHIRGPLLRAGVARRRPTYLDQVTARHEKVGERLVGLALTRPRHTGAAHPTTWATVVIP